MESDWTQRDGLVPGQVIVFDVVALAGDFAYVSF
jgi:hypothetical protein